MILDEDISDTLLVAVAWRNRGDDHNRITIALLKLSLCAEKTLGSCAR